MAEARNEARKEVRNEYIEREALKNDFCNACSTHKRYHRTFDECRNYISVDGNRCFKMRLIDNAPKADVVEVVRCRECKSYNGHRYCTYHADPVLDDDFCSYGERKE